MTGPERLRQFLATATEEQLAAIHAESDKHRGVGPKVSDMIADWDRQAPVLEAFEASRFAKLDEFFNSLTDDEFEALWARVLSRRPVLGNHHEHGDTPISTKPIPGSWVSPADFISPAEREKFRAQEPNPIEVFDEFFGSLTDREFSYMWARVKRMNSGPRAKEYQAYINRMKERHHG